MKHILFIALLLFSSVFSFAHVSHAATLDYSAFRMLPVLHEGRVKPLDTFARVKLTEYAGSEHINNTKAIEWLAETLFDPATAQKRALFQITDADLREQLGLTRDRRLFTVMELQAGLEKLRPQVEELLAADAETHTAPQKELLKLYDHSIDYTLLQRSVSMILPLAVEIPKNLNNSITQPVDYMNLMPVKEDVNKSLQRLIRRKGENTQNYTAEEKKMAVLGFSLEQIRAAGTLSNHFSIISPVGASDEWSSPWPALDNEKSTAHPVLNKWRTLAHAWQNNDPIAWNEASNASYEGMTHLSSAHFSPSVFKLEIIYNMLKPFHLALALYGVAVILLMASFYIAKPILHTATVIAIWLGIAAHTGGIITRIIVLERPPVGTLYESVLFVSVLCAAVAACMARGAHKNIILLPGILAAAALMTIAPTILQRAESMEMLVAVLNTNFWLATHVLCITAGYAICILAACLAHAYLMMRALGQKQENLTRAIFVTALVGLLLTSVGTALGGIWADQSWGRFWGWDPKENGALLIVLWLVWLQHGKISGKMTQLAYAAGTAFLNVIVALAWFGVNLLNVGLHTYGFTSGIAAGLFIFCTAETVIIGGLWLYIALYHKTKNGKLLPEGS
jgi:ABC-type transport system involved in cytochrome c biogenesis permease subunit